MRILFIGLAWIVGQQGVIAQENAYSLAKKLQEQFLSAPAVSFSFNLPEEGRITILDDVHGGHVRLESAKLTIVSDGKTIWNYDKSTNREMIDNVASGSAFRDASSLFRFADNYTARITAQHGSHYTLELSPNALLQSLFGATGHMQTLTLELQMRKNTLRVVSASAQSKQGTTKAERLSISTLKTVPANQFSIHLPKSATVTDLRE
ncbi:MAG TPA: hypothetical protein VGM92_14325 [Candidatus Kapabacteria bacterium]